MVVLCVFAVQATVTLAMLGFCMMMLIRGGETGVYLPVMTGITGFWFPSPLQLQSPVLVQSPAQVQGPVLVQSPSGVHRERVQEQQHERPRPDLAQTRIELSRDSPV